MCKKNFKKLPLNWIIQKPNAYKKNAQICMSDNYKVKQMVKNVYWR